MKPSVKRQIFDEVLTERKNPTVNNEKNKYNPALDRLKDADPYPWLIFTGIIVIHTIIYFLN